ncbi:SH3 domain-containing protein [Limnobaculum parvum]|uniref:SH3 domain-containing protein n=1 Tax=Limnobaculum parvum TaxID=2172103 RepID=A0A2Y9TX69_9GAMM|nr:SH3 domain-containing protein [Limnobaculum parvum]AWH88256.1 SH3 domain-containing protein [Limnobaculum parvum]
MARAKHSNMMITIIVIAVIGFFFKSEKPASSDKLSSQTTTAALSQPLSPHQITPSSPQTLAITQYVKAEKLNVRISPNGKVIASLKQGQKVSVHEQKDSWSRVTPDNEPAGWVSSALLCNTANCYISHPQAVITPVTLRSQPKPQPAARSINYSNSGCSCSSGRICIGPRGGRYCITSGGNKRYGV